MGKLKDCLNCKYDMFSCKKIPDKRLVRKFNRNTIGGTWDRCYCKYHKWGKWNETNEYRLNKLKGD